MSDFSQKKRLKVFLCHAHADREAVIELYSRLIKSRVDAWLDKEKLLPGQDWELEIRKAVQEADVVVVCLSKQFNQAGFRQKEVRLALDTAMEKPEGEIFIVPARLEECDNLESLKKWHWVDLFADNGFGMLMLALQKRADNIGVALQLNRSMPKVTTPPKNEGFVPKETPIRRKTVQSPAEQLRGILSRYEIGDLDRYSYDEIAKAIESLELFQDTYSTDDDLLTLCDLASSIISYLYFARGYATPDVPRNFEYYQNMSTVRRLIQQIKRIR